ncbi:GMC oxidoreductase [Phenylobacterium montanum]|uniref:GMC family oxidoreductase n=1 Tax=Phenylobacterium montanum TaxID=2823693 RepID=A0A975FX42_9CAUL|nr:GMC family oxidoreductase [Caulobacter sp. S6]QUD86905.1 GMC family oxidoreductase [Caulobacter sp. S6]
MADAFDIIIIGSGAGGATLAQRLAPTGKKILILERGEHLPREVENWDPKTVFIDKKYNTKEQWYDLKGKPFVPATHYWVGGNTTFYGAALMRLRKGDFERTQHAGGISPEWPIKLADMAPYYDEAERHWRVHGARGVDPTETGDEPPYAYPAIKDDPGIAKLRVHLEQQGWKPFSLPLGVDLDQEHPVTSACIKCKTCGGYPCLVKAKSDARTLAIEPILHLPNVTLLTGRKVVRLETDGAGRSVTEVVCETEHGEERWNGDIVALAAGAVNTAVILQASHNAAHPNGLANGSDQVGRNYAFHTLTAMVSLTAAPVDTVFPKTLAVNDFYWNDPRGGFDLPMGHIQMLEYMSGKTLEGQVSDWLPPALAPDHLMDAMAHRMLSMLVISEDLPMPDNRVRLGRDGRINLDYTHNNLEGHERLVKTLDAALDGFVDRAHPISQHHFDLSSLLPLYGTAHQVGTTRFGHDPKSSVLDVNCKAHELDNLYVVDSSFFVSSAAVNPTLTIVANAMRVGDHLKERLG